MTLLHEFGSSEDCATQPSIRAPALSDAKISRGVQTTPDGAFHQLHPSTPQPGSASAEAVQMLPESSSRQSPAGPSRPLRAPARQSRTSRLSPMLLLAILTTLLLPLVSAAAPCVRFADYDSINQMFVDGGPGTKVLLCPNKLYRLSGSIIFTAADQELATYGYPTGSERAILRVDGKQTATAIQGDCRRCARVSVRSLIVDGNRQKLGRMVDNDAATGLVVIGGNEGQSIKNCWVKNPRGFTAVHVREGDKLSCTGAVVDKNEIGPVGEEYDPDVDGEDPEGSPLGRPLADGISIACRDSFVRDNTFYDNTDAAIVVFCSPGTQVHTNHIHARSLSAMAGILLVDSTPFDGDYTGVSVKGNIIDAASRSIRVGIGIGATVWSDDTETIIKGGSVTNNGLKGRYMGYGIAAAGLEGWTVEGNWDEAVHEGRKSARCFDEPVNPDPVGYLYNLDTIKESRFQPGFVNHDFQYIVCIDGVYDKQNPPKHDLPPLPHDVHGADADAGDTDPESKARAPVEPREPVGAKPLKGKGKAGGNDDDGGVTGLDSASGHSFSTGSEVMDDILEHSQQRMLEAIDHLHRRVDMLAANVKVGATKGVKDKIVENLDPALSTHLEKVQRRIEHLETSQRALLESATSLRSSIQSWDQEMATIGEWEYDILLDVRHKLDLHLTIPGGGPDDEDADPRHAQPSASRSRSRGGSAADAHERDSDAHAHINIERDELRDLAHKERLRDAIAGNRSSSGGDGSSREDTLSWWIKVLLFQGIVVSTAWAGRRWWRRRRIHSKLL